MFFVIRENLTIIGTAHVSKESVDEVKQAICEQHPDVVAIELDKKRYIQLKKRMNGIEEDDTISVTQIIKDNKVGLFFTSAVLSYMQTKIGADFDVAPGSEMQGAIEACEELGILIALIDRDVTLTLERALNKMGFKEKAKFIFSLIASLFGIGDEEEIDLEEMKNPENIDDMMEIFKDEAPTVYEVLVHERDAYLAAKILNLPQDHVIAVVGAGHKGGIEKYLDSPETLPDLRELETIGEKTHPVSLFANIIDTKRVSFFIEFLKFSIFIIPFESHGTFMTL